MGDSIFDRQSEILMTEDVTVNSSSHEEDFDDVGCNADLYAARQDTFQGSSRSSYERSQQQNDPQSPLFSVARLVLTKSWKLIGEVVFMQYS